MKDTDGSGSLEDLNRSDQKDESSASVTASTADSCTYDGAGNCLGRTYDGGVVSVVVDVQIECSCGRELTLSGIGTTVCECGRSWSGRARISHGSSIQPDSECNDRSQDTETDREGSQ